MKGREQKIFERTKACPDGDRTASEGHEGGQTYMRITENNLTSNNHHSGASCILGNRRIRDPYVRWCERSENEIGGNLFHFPPTRLSGPLRGAKKRKDS